MRSSLRCIPVATPDQSAAVAWTSFSSVDPRHVTYTLDPTPVAARLGMTLMAQAGVIGTGIGLNPGGQVVLRIFTKGIKQATRQTIATKLAGVPVAWEEGEVVAS